MSITGNIQVGSNIQHSSPLSYALPFNTKQSMVFKIAGNVPGSADNVDKKYSADLTLSSTPTIIDLNALFDPFGASFSFAKVRSILIRNRSTTSGQTITLGYATTTTNAWTSLFTGQIVIQPSTATNQGLFVMLSPNDGWAVSSTNKLLSLVGSTTIQATIEIMGSST